MRPKTKVDLGILSEGVHVIRNVPQTIPNNINTFVGFNVELYDDSNYFDQFVSTLSIFIPRLGLYSYGSNIIWTPNAVGERRLHIILNDGTEPICYDRNAGNNTGIALHCHSERRFNKGDNIKVQVLQTSGADLDVLSAFGFVPMFWLSYKGKF